MLNQNKLFIQGKVKMQAQFIREKTKNIAALNYLRDMER